MPLARLPCQLVLHCAVTMNYLALVVVLGEGFEMPVRLRYGLAREGNVELLWAQANLLIADDTMRSGRNFVGLLQASCGSSCR